MRKWPLSLKGQYLANKNKRFSGRSNDFRGSSSIEKKDVQKGCFNCKKHGHFIVDCPEVQKDKSKKGSFKKDSFRNKFKKNLMTTWDELNKEEDSEKDEEQANLTLMALTSSEAESNSNSSSKSEEEDEVFSKISYFDLITLIQDLIGRCQEKVRHVKILKKQ